MAKERNDQSRLGGQYMIQDRDHMVETSAAGEQSADRGVRQSDQSQSNARQQGGDDQNNASHQQGGHRRLTR